MGGAQATLGRRGVWIFIALLFALVLVPFFVLETLGVEMTARMLENASSARMVFVLTVAGLALDVFLPLPSTVIAATAAVVLGGPPAFLAVWLGLSAGCVLGYEFGRVAGRRALDRLVSERQRQRLAWLHGKVGWGALVLCRPVPVLAEVSVLLAGSASVARPVFYPLCLVANVCVAALYVGLAEGAIAVAV